MKRTGGCRTGFTLVELLVVIGVIVILMTISVPMIGKGLGNANRTRCSTNLQQLSQAVSLYSQHNPRNPRGYYPPIPTDRNWLHAVTNYAKDCGVFELFVCPSRANSRKSVTYAGHPLLLANTPSRYKPSDVERPSGVLLIGDRPQRSSESEDSSDAELILQAPFNSAANSTDPNEGETLLPVTGADGRGGSAAFRHRLEGRAAANFAFADGHVEPVATNSLRTRMVAIGY